MTGTQPGEEEALLPPNLVRNDDKPPLGVPVFCGVGQVEQNDDLAGDEGQGVAQLIDEGWMMGASASYDSPPQLSERVDFPLYAFGELPSGFNNEPADMVIRRYETGDIYDVTLLFQPQDADPEQLNLGVAEEASEKQPFVYLLAQAEYLMPAALDEWTTEGLPGPGRIYPTPGGFVVEWLAARTLYTLNVEVPGISEEEALRIARSYELITNVNEEG